MTESDPTNTAILWFAEESLHKCLSLDNTTDVLPLLLNDYMKIFTKGLVSGHLILWVKYRMQHGQGSWYALKTSRFFIIISLFIIIQPQWSYWKTTFPQSLPQLKLVVSSLKIWVRLCLILCQYVTTPSPLASF